MEKLLELLSIENIYLNFFDIPEGYTEGQSKEVVDAFRNYLLKSIS